MVLLRSLLVWILGGSLTISLASIAILFSLFKAQNFVHKIAIFWGRSLCFLCGVEVEINYLERLSKQTPIIILANHQSLFDVVVFYSFLQIPFRWMAKSSLFTIPIFGKAMKGAGHIPVEREDPKKAKESLFKSAQIIKSGTSVILFPEGTRGKEDGNLLPFKKGAFVLAKISEVTIQPITIWGANKVIPIQKGKWIQRVYPNLVQVFIHEPLEFSQIQNLSVEELSLRIREILEYPISKLRLRQEVEESLKTW